MSKRSDFKKITKNIEVYLATYRKAKGGNNPPRVSLPINQFKLCEEFGLTNSYQGVEVRFV